MRLSFGTVLQNYLLFHAVIILVISKKLCFSSEIEIEHSLTRDQSRFKFVSPSLQSRRN